VRLNFLFFFIFQKPSHHIVPPPLSSSSEVSDEDNHPDRRPRYERSPPKKRARSERRGGWGGCGGRGGRTAHRTDSDSHKEESTDVFVHNPGPDDVFIPRSEKWWEQKYRLEARAVARDDRRQELKERRTEAQRHWDREARDAARLREEGYAAFDVAQRVVKRENWIAAGWKPPAASLPAARMTPSRLG
jgi:hypothetical protein